VIDLRKEKDKTDHLTYFIYDKIEEDVDNTKFIEFTEGVAKNTVKAVEKFYKKATQHYKIPDLNIYICISHGMVSQSMKKDNVTDRNNCPTLNALNKRILEKIPVYNRKRNGRIGLLDEHEESELTHIGVIPKESQADVALVDIGSGNTKGGYFIFEPIRKFMSFEIVEGILSLSNRAKADLQPEDFDKYYFSRVQDMVNVQMSTEIRSCASDLRTKLDIVLTGGIAWAVARITNLEDNKDMQRIKVEDVNRFINIVADNDAFKKLQTKANLPNNKDLKQVLNVFNQDILIAGGILMKKMLEEIKRGSSEYRFYVYKASYVGWLKGYIISDITNANPSYKAAGSKFDKQKSDD
jgi:hypothetical protein